MLTFLALEPSRHRRGVEPEFVVAARDAGRPGRLPGPPWDARRKRGRLPVLPWVATRRPAAGPGRPPDPRFSPSPNALARPPPIQYPAYQDIEPPSEGPHPMRLFRTAPLVLLSTIVFLTAAPAAATVGYYRQPALCKDGIVFVAEGDLWKVGDKGGDAMRLTSNVGDESLPAVSPDGKTLAFAGQYDGPTEVYTMPITGGSRAAAPSTAPTSPSSAGRPTAKSSSAPTPTPRCRRRASSRSTSARKKSPPCANPSRSPRPPTASTTSRARRSSSRACRSRAATPSATRAAPPRTFGNTPTGDAEAVAAHRRLSRHEQKSHVVARPRLFSLRPRRHHEPLVDEARRLRPETAHETFRLGRRFRLALRRPRRLPARRRYSSF